MKKRIQKKPVEGKSPARKNNPAARPPTAPAATGPRAGKTLAQIADSQSALKAQAEGRRPRTPAEFIRRVERLRTAMADELIQKGMTGAAARIGADQHWTKYVDPPTEEAAAEVAKPYGAPLMEDSPEAAAIAFAEWYYELREKEFDESMAEFHGLFQLMRHNPHFKTEIEALRMLIQGESILNHFSAKVRIL